MTEPQPAPAIAATPKTSGLAIASLVTGLTCLSPLAIIFGHMSLSRIKKSGGAVTGSGLALAGTILGYVSLALNLLLVIPILVTGAKAWEKGANRSACIMNQRNVEQMIQSYANLKSLEEGASLDMEKIMADLEVEGISTTCPDGGELIISPIYLGSGESHSQCTVPDHQY